MSSPSYNLDVGSLPLLFGERIEFNGFVFNDHSTLERARIAGIDGLMDSDIRDSRQESPDQDGEDFFDLLRGGRTLSFEGELTAGNLHSLANLRQRMKAAVSGIDDLWFNRYDWDDDFKTAAVVTTALVNLITNPSYEVDTTGWAFGGTATQTTFARAARTWIGSSGSYGLHVAATATVNQIAFPDQTTRIPVVPGQDYSARASAEVVGTLAGSTAYIALSWWSETGNYLGSTDGASVAAAAAGVISVSVSGTAPDGAAYVGVRPHHKAGGTGTLEIWWDSIMCVQATNFVGPYFDGASSYCNWTGTAHDSTSINPHALATLVNRIANPSFENQTTTGWGALRGVLTTAATSSGQGSYKGRNTVNAAGNAGWNYQHIPVFPGETYTAFGRFINLSGRTGQLNIEWRDGNGSLISTTAGVSNTNTAPRVTSGVAPSNAVEAVVTLYAASAQIGDLIEIDACGFVAGSPTEYFDGDSEGCFWKGSRNISESVKGTPVPVSKSFLVYADEDKVIHSPSTGKLAVKDSLTTGGSEAFLYKVGAKPTCDSRMMSAISNISGNSGLMWLGHCHKVIKPGTVGYANSTTTPRGVGLTADLIAAVVSSATQKLAIWRVSGGSALILDEFTIPGIFSVRPAWFVTEMRGNEITLALWTKDPRDDNAAATGPEYSTTLALTGNDATKYGAGVYQPTGLWMGGGAEVAGGVELQEHVVEGINPSDAVILSSRRNSPIAGRESQDSYEYKRSFQFTLRSSDPMIYSRAMEFSFIDPTQVSDYGASYDWSYDINFDSPIDSSGNVVSAGTVTVKNVGDADAYPEIVFANGLVNPTFTNLTTGESLTIRGTVGDGEWKSYNMRTGYSLDSVGDDCSGLIDPSSDRVSIAPGDNVVVVTAQNFSSFGGVLLRHRNTFK